MTALQSALMPTGNMAASITHKPDRLLRLNQVKDIVALGKTMIYRLVREGRFPQPLKLCGRATRWSEAEVYTWLAAQSASRH